MLSSTQRPISSYLEKLLVPELKNRCDSDLINCELKSAIHYAIYYSFNQLYRIVK